MSNSASMAPTVSASRSTRRGRAVASVGPVKDGIARDDDAGQVDVGEAPGEVEAVERAPAHAVGVRGHQRLDRLAVENGGDEDEVGRSQVLDEA